MGGGRNAKNVPAICRYAKGVPVIPILVVPPAAMKGPTAPSNPFSFTVS